MGWFGQGLPFDGAQYFMHIVDLHHFTNYFQRYSAEPFEYPTLFASSHTSSLLLLRRIFGLSYAVVPFGALLASWLVVRRRNPALMVWPVLGIAIVGLPGLLFPISESVIVAEWMWPLLLLTLVSLDGLSFIAGILFSAFLFFLAADSLVVFVVVAVVATIRSMLQRTVRARMLVWTALMVLAAGLRYFAFHLDFAGHPTSLSMLGSEFTKAEVGLPLVAYVLTAAAGVIMLELRHHRMSTTRCTERLPAVLVALAGVSLAVYASDGALWYRANLDRDIMILLELPFVVLALVDELVPVLVPNESREPDSGVRGPIILVTGLAMCLSLVLWSASWSGQTSLLVRQLKLATTYCVAPSAVAALLPTQVSSNKNGVPNPFREELAIEYQSRTPAHIVISSADCEVLHNSGKLILFDFAAGASGHWFHISSGVSVQPSSTEPTISSFEPLSGAVGTVVIIMGTNLSGASKVTVDGVATTIVKDRARRLRIKIPAGATTGKIQVTTPAGNVDSSSDFKVT